MPKAVALFCVLIGSSPLFAAEAMAAPDQAAAPESNGASLQADDTDYYEEDETETELIADPLEGFNRAVFWFNDKIYFYALKPVARGYRLIPQGARVSVSNFFANLRAPVRVVNAGLQLKFDDAGREILRFLINTTVGIGGLFDPAKRYAGLRQKDEDFGQTLGGYGVNQGFYLVLPFLGASSARDGVGDVVDIMFDPIPPVIYSRPSRDIVIMRVWEVVNYTSLDRDTYEKIKREALDPYTFIKNAYAQSRAAQVAR